LRAQKVGDQVHRARAVQRDQRDDVLEHAGLRVAQHALHARAFQLEHRDGLALAHQLVGRPVVQRDAFEREVAPVLVARADEVLGHLEDGQRGQAQEVELHQAAASTSSLSNWLTALSLPGCMYSGQKSVILPGRDQHAAGVHADVAHHALDALGQREQLGDLFLVLLALLDLGRFLACVDHAVSGLSPGRASVDGLAGRRGHQLGDAVDMAVAHAQHAADVAQRGLGGHRAEGRDLADRVAAVLLLDVVDHAVAVALAEVDVEVGHRHALGVQEAARTAGCSAAGRGR
jgi:hypothetical protein